MTVCRLKKYNIDLECGDILTLYDEGNLLTYIVYPGIEGDSVRVYLVPYPPDSKLVLKYSDFDIELDEELVKVTRQGEVIWGNDKVRLTKNEKKLLNALKEYFTENTNIIKVRVYEDMYEVIKLTNLKSDVSNTESMVFPCFKKGKKFTGLYPDTLYNVNDLL